MHPSFTVFNADTKTFSSTWCEYHEDYSTFEHSVKAVIEKAQSATGYFARTVVPDIIFNVSMIPWFHFEAFNLFLPKSRRYFVPIFTLGQFIEEDEHTVILLAFQVHHAVCDGWHAILFLERLKEEIGNWNR